MYTFSSKLKTFSFVLMIIGILGIGYGFLTAPKTIQDVETILKEEEAHHEGGHETAASHEAAATHQAAATYHSPAVTHEEAVAETTHDTIAKDTVTAVTVAETAHTEHVENNAEAHADEHAEHVEHVFHQLKNKPWSALYVASIFFLLITEF
jgi:hypothetical protein